MTNVEMANILATKVHGWELRRTPFSDEWYDSNGFWCGMVPNIDEPPEDGSYNPPTNIAQAFEAIKAYCAKHKRTRFEMTRLYMPVDKAPYWVADLSDWDSRDHWCAKAPTPEQAITEALVKAVSDD